MEEFKMYLPVCTVIDDGVKKVLRKAEETGLHIVADFNGFLIDSNYSYEKNLERFKKHSDRPIPKMDPRDWEQRRYEIAKTMLPVIYTADGRHNTLEGCCREAVRFADTLIWQLENNELSI